ncbi:MAG: RloB domain-containing protein [Anaerovoracaceae bacterium]
MRKENRKYYFTVEGETEQRYFKWLESTINKEQSSRYTVKLDCQVQKDPLKRVKSLISLGTTEITHIFDYEGNDKAYSTQFQTTLDRMKEAGSSKVGKNVVYLLGYSNFTFELWIVLHKVDCNGAIADRSQYLALINRAYAENFDSLKQYKKKIEFERILNNLTLDDVREAIKRAKNIMQKNKENGLALQQYKGYKYYRENPSLSIWQTIEKILKDCEL